MSSGSVQGDISTSYKENLRQAKRYIDAGNEMIPQGGVIREKSGNSFRTAGEYLLFARIEACGFTRDDVDRWSDAQNGRVFREPRTPSFSDCKKFLNDLRLVAEEEPYLEKVRLIGNDSSHANASVRQHNEEDFLDVSRAITILYEKAEALKPENAYLMAAGAREVAFSRLLGNSLMTDQLESWIERDREKGNLPEAQRRRLESNEASLCYMKELQTYYYKRLACEFPAAANTIVRASLVESVNEQLKAFVNKWTYLDRKKDQIERKKDYIDRKKNQSDFDRSAITDLRELEKERDKAKSELDGIVESLKTKFKETNGLIGARYTKDIRDAAGKSIKRGGYSRYLFETDRERYERKEAEKARREREAAEELARMKKHLQIAGIIFGFILMFLLLYVIFTY